MTIFFLFAGVAGAEPVPSRKKKWTTGWVETDLDSMVSIDRAQEVELQLKKESGLKKSQLKSSNQNVYVNTYEEEEHGYENFDPGNGSRNRFQTGNGHFANGNPYEDDVQTVHSEGVRSARREREGGRGIHLFKYYNSIESSLNWPVLHFFVPFSYNGVKQSSQEKAPYQSAQSGIL